MTITVIDCHLCGRSVYSSRTSPNNKAPANIKNKSVQHLWSYLFHHNVRETLSPSSTTTTRSTISTTITNSNLPKLSFDLYWNNCSSDQCDEDNEVMLQFCHQCSEQLDKLDKLHEELETLKILVSAQVQAIDNLCQSNCSRNETRENELNKIVTHSLFQKDRRSHGKGLSFAGVSSGKENISQLIKFLTTICEGIPPTPSFKNRHNKKARVAQSHSADNSFEAAGERQDISRPVTGTQEEIVPVPIMGQDDDAEVEPLNTSDEMDIKYEYGTFIPLIIPPENEDDSDEDSTDGSVTDINFDPLADEDQGGSCNSPINTPTSNFKSQSHSKGKNVYSNSHLASSPSTSSSLPVSSLQRSFSSVTGRKSNPPEEKNQFASSSLQQRQGPSSSQDKSGVVNRKDTEPCSVCGKLIVKRHMHLHTRVHTGEKPYECDICKKRFAQKKSLNEHRKLHTRVCPYVCQLCSDGFPSQRALVRHFSREHGKRT